MHKNMVYILSVFMNCKGLFPVFDSFLRQKVSQTALLATCETFFYFYDCTLHYLFFCLGNNFFHFRYRYDLL